MRSHSRVRCASNACATASISVDGTPTDCVNIAITTVLARRPDLVVSGINKGYNLGDDVTYSGTVAGALEAALLGVPGLARVARADGATSSTSGRPRRSPHTLAAACCGSGLPPRTLLNVNVPRGPVPRARDRSRQGKRNHVTKVDRVDRSARPAYYWIEEGESAWEDDERSDYHAVRAGFVSVTPLQPDLRHAAWRWSKGD